MTPLAQEVIDRERRERTGYLDIGRCGLTEIPDLSDMDWLHTLVVANGWWDMEKMKYFISMNKGSYNNIKAPAPVPCLPTRLRKLVLSGISVNEWQISNLNFLNYCNNLLYLDVSSNKLHELTLNEYFKNLKYLNISNQANLYSVTGDVPNIEYYLKAINITCNLENLINIKINYNSVLDISFLYKCKNVLYLYIINYEDMDAYSRILNIDSLLHLTNLTLLDIRCSVLRDISILAGLSNLTSLNLNSCYLSDISPLSVLTKLTSLDLSGNRLTDVSALSGLTKLISLELNHSQLTDVSRLQALTKLTWLELNHNQLTDVSGLSGLTKLISLELNHNQLTDVNGLLSLTDLTSLELNHNQLIDIHALSGLTNLTSLELNHNQLIDIHALSGLTNLTSLDLSNNQLTDVSALSALTNLTSLNLSNNRLTDISPLLPLIEKGLTVSIESYDRDNKLNLHGNPITNPPIEVVEKGNAAMLEYFRQQERTGVELLLEAKMVLLGDGRSGKTSLANRLLAKPLPAEEDRTQGVDIVIGQYAFPVLGEEKPFTLHIWDFAGQDKYKPLHQFFYTEGAVYVMVADSGNAKTDYDDWFQTAYMFGKDSPLLLVLNEFREGMGYGAFDEDHWRRQFPRLLKEVHLCNLKSRTGWEAVERDIRHFAQGLPHTRTPYPKNWAAIRRELERRRDENVISLSEYLKICRENDLPERDSALILSSVLHTIGICLHYQQSELLRQYVILKNEWATGAVYQILEDGVVADQKKGFFDWDDLKRIWSDDAYCDLRPQLLELMQQFRLCYPLPHGGEYVAPPLLPVAPPPDWAFPDGEALSLYLTYDFLPKALMTQFIVTRHADIDHGRTLVWRNGVVLRWPDALAEVARTKHLGREGFLVRVKGHNRRSLLTAILQTFRSLHAEYPGVRAEELVPCPCEGCHSGRNKQHYFDYENLRNRLEKGRRMVECDKSLEEVDLLALLENLLMFKGLVVGRPVELSTPRRTFRIFLASSEELAEDRKALRQYISEHNDRHHDRPESRYLQLENWEAMSAAMDPVRKQNDYNERIPQCDLFVCLAHTKVGKYTEEEFDLAWQCFQETGRPKIVTYFKQDGVDPLAVAPSLRAFHDKLTQQHQHFPAYYAGYADLERQLRSELERM